MADEENKPEDAPAKEAASAEEKPAATEKVAKEAPAAKEEAAPKKDAAKEEAPAAEAKEGAPAAAAEGEKPAEGDKAAAEGEKPAEGKPGEKKDIFAELDPSEGEAPKVVKAKGSKNVTTGIVHVRASFNNTIVTVSDINGNVIGWSSSGKQGFRGSRKSTAYAAQIVAQDACRQAMSHGLREAEVRVTGPGSGREAAVRAVQGLGIDVSKIADVTPIPHNGCRPPKARRV